MTHELTPGNQVQDDLSVRSMIQDYVISLGQPPLGGVRQEDPYTLAAVQAMPILRPSPNGNLADTDDRYTLEQAANLDRTTLFSMVTDARRIHRAIAGDNLGQTEELPGEELSRIVGSLALHVHDLELRRKPEDIRTAVLLSLAVTDEDKDQRSRIVQEVIATRQIPSDKEHSKVAEEYEKGVTGVLKKALRRIPELFDTETFVKRRLDEEGNPVVNIDNEPEFNIDRPRIAAFERLLTEIALVGQKAQSAGLTRIETRELYGRAKEQCLAELREPTQVPSNIINQESR